MDLATLIARSRGMILESTATFESDGRPSPPWQVVMREHVLPLVLFSVLASTVLVLLFGLPEAGLALSVDATSVLTMAIMRIITHLLVFLIVARIAAAVSGLFGGRRDFDGGATLIGLAFTPLWLSEALFGLPFIGVLASLAGTIYAFVLVYRGGPVCLDLPDYARGRFVGMIVLATFATSLVIQSVLSFFLGGL